MFSSIFLLFCRTSSAEFKLSVHFSRFISTFSICSVYFETFLYQHEFRPCLGSLFFVKSGSTNVTAIDVVGDGPAEAKQNLRRQPGGYVGARDAHSAYIANSVNYCSFCYHFVLGRGDASTPPRQNGPNETRAHSPRSPRTRRETRGVPDRRDLDSRAITRTPTNETQS